jgi:hypothetical protein
MVRRKAAHSNAIYGFYRMIGCADFNWQHAFPRVIEQRVNREHGEPAAGNNWATMPVRARNRGPVENHRF